MPMTMLELYNDPLKHNISIKDICWHVNIFYFNSVTGDLMKTVYIRNNSRETLTKQISDKRERG